ncbi:hypothetical protein L3Y34_008895 [Caenorhabditis briggsae]|uniref:Uncharacterized protein n=2 Tax=Caenorhabditis briggsae TaxID=6238 RepID=A0AAE9A6X1_CAEBR|nr:hypothetical protein L3Y34_008895 [Caenorhabditis briggsae]
MTRLQRSLGFFLLISSLVTNCSTLKCYDSSLQSQNCEAIDLWCIKFINGSTITRGCANVYDFCTDEDAGCYPEREEDGLTQKWCCCQKDNCNSVSTQSIYISIFTLICAFWILKL